MAVGKFLEENDSISHVLLYTFSMKHFSVTLATILSLASLPLPAPAASPLTVEIASPASTQTIPQGAQRVPMLTVTLNAGCSNDVTVNQMTLVHTGKGEESDIERVYALSNNRRVSRASTISGANQTVTLRFIRLKLAACTSQTFDVVADYAPTAASGGEHALMLKESSDIVSTTSEVTVIRQETTTRTTTPARTGTIDVSYPPLSGSVTFGAQRTVARINLEADNQSDHVITSIIFTNDGKARDEDLQNLKLFTSNEKQVGSTLKQLEGDLAAFVFDPPLLLEKNQTRSFVLKADVRASKRKTIRFVIEEPADITAVSGKQRGQKFQ